MDKTGESRLHGEVRTILKKVSRTLYLSVAVLPEPVRGYMGLGYLLCRALDTVVDTPDIPAAEKLRLLALARSLDKPGPAAELLAGMRALAALPAPAGEKELLLRFDKVLAMRSGLPAPEKAAFHDLLDGVSRGMETDVRSFPGGQPAALKTPADLEEYCRLIGGAPGVFWSRLYREAIRRSSRAKNNPPSEKDGEMIGSALQITNILKDMSADLRIGRCYIPLEELDARGIGPAELLDRGNMGRLRDIISKWTYWALDRLDQSEAFVQAIPKTELALRAAVIWPVYWAMDTLEEVQHSNLLDPADRPRVPRSRIYRTIAATPPLLLSNTAFARGYRFRRETLISSVNGGNFEGRAI